MKIKKILASVLLAVTLFNMGVISYADEIDNSSSTTIEEQIDFEQDEYSLKDVFNKLEKENKISKKQNKKIQKKIKHNDNKIKIRTGLKIIVANSLILGLLGSCIPGGSIERLFYFSIGVCIGGVSAILEALSFFLIK